MKNNITYFIFACDELIESLVDINNSITDVINIIEEEGHSYTLYEYNPEIDSPAIILHKFIISGEEEYSTITKEEFRRLSNG